MRQVSEARHSGSGSDGSLASFSLFPAGLDTEPTLEEEMLKLVHDSYWRVKQLIMSDEYPSLHDDLEVLRKEQINWLLLGYDGQSPMSGSDSSSDSEDEGISDPMLELVD